MCGWRLSIWGRLAIYVGGATAVAGCGETSEESGRGATGGETALTGGVPSGGEGPETAGGVSSGEGGTGTVGAGGSMNTNYSVHAAVRVQPTSPGCGVGPYLIPADANPTSDDPGTSFQRNFSGEVRCSAEASGTGFTIVAGVSSYDTARSFRIEGGVSMSGEGSGSVVFSDLEVGYVMSDDCTIVVGEGQEVGLEQLHADFFCTDSRAVDDSPTCDIEGTFYCVDW